MLPNKRNKNYRIACRGHLGAHGPCAHSHDPVPGGGRTTATQRIGWALFLNFGFCLLEFVGGYLASSVALVSDAVHDLGDSLSLALAWWLERVSNKKSNERFTYGFRRFSVLSALISSVVIITSAIFIIFSAWQRLLNPQVVDSDLVLIFSLLGIAVNSFGFWRLSKGGSLNEKVIKYHLLEDILGWVLVLLGALAMKWGGWFWVDPLLAILIALWMIKNMWTYLKSSVGIFLQAWPESLLLPDIEKFILAFPSVHSVHHIHAWTLDGEKHVLSFHLELKDGVSFVEANRIKNEIKSSLKQRWSLVDVTIELENINNCSEPTHD